VTPRLALLAYAVGFAAMTAAGVVLAVAALGTLNSVTILWVSSAFSVAAVVAAVVSVVLSRR
jgi:hypothetical protein